MKCYLNLENCWRTDPKYNESTNKSILNAVNILRYAPCKGIDSQRRILDSTPWIPDNSYEFQCLSVELGFWIPIVSLIPESMSCLPDSEAKDSGFRKNFLDSEIWIPLHRAK